MRHALHYLCTFFREYKTISYGSYYDEKDVAKLVADVSFIALTRRITEIEPPPAFSSDLAESSISTRKSEGRHGQEESIPKIVAEVRHLATLVLLFAEDLEATSFRALIKRCHII